MENIDIIEKQFERAFFMTEYNHHPHDVALRINALADKGKCAHVSFHSCVSHRPGSAPQEHYGLYWELWKWLHTRCLDGLGSRMCEETGTTRLRLHLPYDSEDEEAYDTYDGDSPEKALLLSCIEECDRIERYMKRERESLEKRINKAVNEILQYGQTDGSHHKMHTIDTVLRILTGSDYEKVIDDYQGKTYEDGSREYEWDCGTP